MTSGHMKAIAVAAFLAPLATAYPAYSMAHTLAPHRAVYDVALKDSSDRSGITSLSGRIVFEFQGSACDGYTTNFRFVTRVRSASGVRLTDQQTSTYEDGPHGVFRFLTKSFVDEKLDHEVSGTATRENDRIVVTMQKPNEGEVILEPALYPSAHMLDLISRAAKGETFYETKIFDASDEADRVMTTTVVIGREKTVLDGDAAAASDLKDAPYRNVSISYYDEGTEDHSGEALPEYEIAFKLYDNGVTRDLMMDYGDFALTGHLTHLELLPLQRCDGQGE